MNRRHLLTLFAASAGALVTGALTNAGGFKIDFTQEAKRNSLLIASARAMFDVCNALAAAYRQKNPLTDFVIERGDSLQALISAKRGAIDIAAITRDLTNEEDDMASFNYLIARSHISIVVNPRSPLSNLSQTQVADVLSGKTNSWKQLGGSDAPIHVVSRVRGSSTRQYVEEAVLAGRDFSNNATEVESTKLLAQAVAADEFAIGYIAAKDSAEIAVVKYLNIDGVEATPATILSGRYAYTHPFCLLISGEQTGSKFDFVKFARSPAGQAIVAQQGLIPVC